MLLVYAIVDNRAKLGALRGGAREPLRAVKAGRVVAIVGEVEAAPAASAERLEAQDSALRRLARIAPAILPARFATVLADEDALTERLAASEKVLRDALVQVDGREQMTLRVFGEARPARASHSPRPVSGTQFLQQRARVSGVPELDPIRPFVAPIVRAERVQRSETAPLLATAYHLIDRGAGRKYAAAVKRAAGRVPEMRFQVTGPFVPYAFAPESAW